MIAGFEAQASQCNQQQEEFADFMDRINESIDESTKQFEYIEYFEGSLRDCMAHETAIAFSDINSLDPRRRSLAGVSPLVASNAVLLPEPEVSPEVFDNIQADLVQKVNSSIGQPYSVTLGKPDAAHTEARDINMGEASYNASAVGNAHEAVFAGAASEAPYNAPAAGKNLQANYQDLANVLNNIAKNKEEGDE